MNLPGFLWRSSAIRIPAFSFSKRALTLSILFSAVLLFREDGFFHFLRTISRASKRALGEMEVNREESEEWKFQNQTNQTRIPFPHGASYPDGEARLYGIPIVRGMSLSQPRLSVSGRGRGVYAHTTDETIKEDCPSGGVYGHGNGVRPLWNPEGNHSGIFSVNGSPRAG